MLASCCWPRSPPMRRLKKNPTLSRHSTDDQPLCPAEVWLTGHRAATRPTREPPRVAPLPTLALRTGAGLVSKRMALKHAGGDGGHQPSGGTPLGPPPSSRTRTTIFHTAAGRRCPIPARPTVTGRRSGDVWFQKSHPLREYHGPAPCSAPLRTNPTGRLGGPSISGPTLPDARGIRR